MATPVFRSRVHVDYHFNVSITREQGDAIIVDGERFVRLLGGSFMLGMTGEWHYSPREADLSVLATLHSLRGRVDDLVATIQRPLPAADAAQVPASGRAHAGVAT